MIQSLYVRAALVLAVLGVVYWGVNSKLLTVVGLCVVAAQLLDLIFSAAHTILPRNLLPGLQKRAVLITGCDSGFGYLLACRLDSLQVTVYAGCLDAAGQGAEALRDTCSSRLQVLQLDVTSDEQVAAAVEKVKSSLRDKVLWAVVNNAGISVYCELDWCSMESFKKVLAVNTLGPIAVTKAFLPLLRKSKGRVVIVASMLGKLPFAMTGAYCVSKYGVMAFADVLRIEMKKWSVSVHSIEPHVYSTNISENTSLMGSLMKSWNDMPDEMKEEYGKAYLEESQELVDNIVNLSKPKSKTYEVVDDLLDAAIGANPKRFYVPSVWSQFEIKMINYTPTFLWDRVVRLIVIPKKPPAAVW